MNRPHHPRPRLRLLRLLPVLCAAAALAAWLAAVAALLPPPVTWAGLWGDAVDFVAPTAAQSRADGWVSISERV